MTDERVTPALLAVLERARRRGFLGPGPVGDHVAHALALAAFAGVSRVPVLDLGAGGGVPGLVMTCAWPAASMTLLDAGRRRSEHLEAAVSELGLQQRVQVVHGRAEVLARDPTWRARFGLVVARGFGSPAVTAECAVGFLRAGGALVVSEPPGRDDRWPADPLRPLGLRVTRRAAGQGGSFVELVAEGAPAERWPRRNGVPRKRPLWS